MNILQLRLGDRRYRCGGDSGSESNAAQDAANAGVANQQGSYGDMGGSNWGDSVSDAAAAAAAAGVANQQANYGETNGTGLTSTYSDNVGVPSLGETTVTADRDGISNSISDSSNGSGLAGLGAKLGNMAVAGTPGLPPNPFSFLLSVYQKSPAKLADAMLAAFPVLGLMNLGVKGFTGKTIGDNMAAFGAAHASPGETAGTGSGDPVGASGDPYGLAGGVGGGGSSSSGSGGLSGLLGAGSPLGAASAQEKNYLLSGYAPVAKEEQQAAFLRKLRDNPEDYQHLFDTL